MQALEEIRVLDATRLLPGALATLYLADFGADVIKIEQPGVGDYARQLFSTSDENPFFIATNRGKRSVAIDFKKPEGKEALLRLARGADVLIEGFRPGVMDRLGLGFQVLHEVNPRLIYAALTGYGQSGPLRDAAGHDINYLATAGVLDLIGERNGPPVVPGVQIADIAGGAMQSVMGVMLALAARERTGEGQFVDISMTRGSVIMLALALAQLEAGAREPARGEGILSGQYACYGVYRCRDGRWIAVGALERKFWDSLCRGLGRGDLIEDHFAPEPRQARLKSELAGIFAQKDAADWVRELEAHDCCVTLVSTVAEAGAEGWLEVDQPAPGLSATPGKRGATAPKLGEHTRQVLREAGVAEADIEHYFRQGAIA